MTEKATCGELKKRVETLEKQVDTLKQREVSLTLQRHLNA